MENASKALIIAGAILLAILIISLGIMIYNQAAGVVNNNAMDEVEVAAFNQKFTQYEGSNIKGAQVNALLNAIMQSNITNQEDQSKVISITVEASSWQAGSPKPSGAINGTAPYSKAQTGKTYIVSFTYEPKTGLINTVNIKDAT